MPQRLEVTHASLIKHMKVQLGWPTACVELSDDALEDAAFDAEIWIAVHMGIERRTTLDLYSGQSEYNMPDDCEMVIDIAFPQVYSGSLPLAMQIEGLEDLYYAQFYQFGTRAGGFNSNIIQHLQYLDMTQRTLSSDKDRRWESYQRKLIVQPDDVTGTAIVWYLSNQVEYDYLSLPAKMLIRRYAVAAAMLILGRIRSKYSEIPAAGGKVSLNGAELIGSAEGEMAMLDEKVGRLVPPPGFITG